MLIARQWRTSTVVLKNTYDEKIVHRSGRKKRKKIPLWRKDMDSVSYFFDFQIVWRTENMQRTAELQAAPRLENRTTNRKHKCFLKNQWERQAKPSWVSRWQLWNETCAFKIDTHYTQGYRTWPFFPTRDVWFFFPRKTLRARSHYIIPCQLLGYKWWRNRIDSFLKIIHKTGDDEKIRFLFSFY